MGSDPKEQAKKLRDARAALRSAKCTCGYHGHDPFWIGCPRTVAEIDVDAALVAMGIEI